MDQNRDTSLALDSFKHVSDNQERSAALFQNAEPGPSSCEQQAEKSESESESDSESGLFIHEPQVIIECGEGATQAVEGVWVKQEPNQEEDVQGSYYDAKTHMDNFPESIIGHQVGVSGQSRKGLMLSGDEVEDRAITNCGTRSRRPWKAFRCAACPYSSNQAKAVERHTANRHGEEKLLKCAKCAYTTNRPHSLKAHSVTHTGIKPYKCERCPYITACPSNLKKHLHTHTGERPYKCAQCAYSCAESTCLKRHVATKHSGERPHMCGVCNFRSGRLDNLRRHEATHSETGDGAVHEVDTKDTTVQGGDEKNTTFHVKNMPTQGADLKGVALQRVGTKDKAAHGVDKKTTADHGKDMAVQPVDRRFMCGLCDYTSARPGPLRVHVARHTGRNPFACPRCAYSTADKSNLNKHLRLVHSEKRGSAAAVPPASSNDT